LCEADSGAERIGKAVQVHTNRWKSGLMAAGESISSMRAFRMDEAADPAK
jgi:hypothetical protein